MHEALSHHEQTVYGGMEPDGDQAAQDKDGQADPLRSPENEADYRQIHDWWVQARTVQAAWRYEMAIDDDFYDSLQWSEEDQLVLEGRGQAALTFNQIKPVIDWIIGTQKRAKYDWHVYPRTADDRKPAETKSKVLKYTDDVNHTQFHRSRGFAEAVRAGVGWLEDGIRGDPTEEPLYSRMESWRNIWCDHLATEPDLSDARYLFRSRWADVDIASAYFPDHAGRIKAAAHTHDLYGAIDDEGEGYQLYYQTDGQGRPLPKRSYTEDASFALQNRRQRVRLVECWYRKPVARKILRLYDSKDPNYARLNGEIFDPANGEVQAMVDAGMAGVFDAIKLEVWCAIFIEGGLLQNMRSPYRHDKFPFTPIWAYRRKRDGAPYGQVRAMRDPQEDLNKRRSKALHILNTKQVIAEEGAVADVEEAREQAAAPDGWIEVRKNRRFEFVQDTAVAAEHLKMEMMNREYIREGGGVTSENLGHESNATSGKAIKARQDEGAVVTTELFDNLYFALKLQGEKRLSLIEQFYSATKVVRLTSDRGAMEFLTVNDVTGVGPNGEPVVENDITASKADFTVDLVDYRQTMRQAMFDELFEMMGNLVKMGEKGAEAAWNMLDLVVDMWDGPGKEALVARVRKLNGQPDPAQEGTPEAEEAMAAKEQRDAEAAELQKRAIMAEVELAEQKAIEARSKAALTKQQALGEALRTLTESVAVGQALTVTPEIAAMLDELLAFVNEQVNPQPQQMAA